MSFSSLSIGLIETAFNKAVNLDPITKQSLAELRGNIIAVVITDIERTLYFVPDREKTLILDHTNDEADATLSATTSVFIAMATSSNKTDAIMDKQLIIRGNTGIAQRFGKILSSLNIDWEEQLSHIIGDIPAHIVGSNTRSAKNYLLQLKNTAQLDIQEYLQEELKTLPHPLEIEQFTQTVDILRNDVERIQQRIHQLRNAQK